MLRLARRPGPQSGPRLAAKHIASWELDTAERRTVALASCGHPPKSRTDMELNSSAGALPARVQKVPGSIPASGGSSRPTRRACVLNEPPRPSSAGLMGVLCECLPEGCAVGVPACGVCSPLDCRSRMGGKQQQHQRSLVRSTKRRGRPSNSGQTHACISPRVARILVGPFTSGWAETRVGRARNRTRLTAIRFYVPG